MEKSTLYDLLSKAIFDDWREEASKDKLECFDRQEKETKAELLKELPEKCKDALCHYKLAIEEQMDYLHYNLQVKILNLGIQIGTELAFLLDEE